MWAAFGLIWDLRMLGAIGTYHEELGNLVCDFAAKVRGARHCAGWFTGRCLRCFAWCMAAWLHGCMAAWLHGCIC
jgi:hypothetical protein